MVRLRFSSLELVASLITNLLGFIQSTELPSQLRSTISPQVSLLRPSNQIDPRSIKLTSSSFPLVASNKTQNDRILTPLNSSNSPSSEPSWSKLMGRRILLEPRTIISKLKPSSFHLFNTSSSSIPITSQRGIQSFCSTRHRIRGWELCSGRTTGRQSESTFPAVEDGGLDASS